MSSKGPLKSTFTSRQRWSPRASRSCSTALVIAVSLAFAALRLFCYHQAARNRYAPRDLSFDISHVPAPSLDDIYSESVSLTIQHRHADSAPHTKAPLPFPVRAFWHIGNSGAETWRVVVMQQLRRLYTSGLLESMNVTATFVGSSAAQMPRFADPHIEVAYGGRPQRFEFPTLEKLWNYCQQVADGRVVYLHTKGARYPLDTPRGVHTYHWRRWMEYFVMDLHHTVLADDLSDSSRYVAVGPSYARDLRPPHHPHYSGNMWAARCSYINSLRDIHTVNQRDRMQAELWPGSGADFEQNHKSCWDFRVGECVPMYYNCSVPEMLYSGLKVCGRPCASDRWVRREHGGLACAE